MQVIGVVVNGVFTKILTNVKPGTILHYDILVDITGRPDVQVGDLFPLGVEPKREAP